MKLELTFIRIIAELRHLPWPSQYDDSPDEFDNKYAGKGDTMRTTRGSGRIIVLGDGTEVLSDTEDAEMFDDEDKDEEELEKKKSTGTKGKAEGQKDEVLKSTEAASNGTSEVVVPDQSSR